VLQGQAQREALSQASKTSSQDKPVNQSLRRPLAGEAGQEVEVKIMRNMALVALCAGALLALPAAASASGGFASESYPNTVEATPGTLKLYTKSGAELLRECTAPTLTKTMNAPEHALGLPGTKTGSCVGGGATDMRNCQLILHTGNPPTAEIGPPSCEGMQVTLCGGGFTIKPQTGIPLTYGGGQLAEGWDVLEETLGISGVVKTEPGWCSSEVKLTANWNLNTSSNLWAVRDYTPVGVTLSDEKHPRTTAQTYPVDVAAVVQPPVEPPAMVLEKIGSVDVKARCYGVDLSAGEFTKEAETEFSLSGSYWGRQGNPTSEYCTSNSGTAAVSMNSCHYEIPEAERTAPGTYTVIGGALVCTKEGDGLTITSSCKFTIPPQSLPMTLRNSGNGISPRSSSKSPPAVSNTPTMAPGCAISWGFPHPGKTVSWTRNSSSGAFCPAEQEPLARQVNSPTRVNSSGPRRMSRAAALSA